MGKPSNRLQAVQSQKRQPETTQATTKLTPSSTVTQTPVEETWEKIRGQQRESIGGIRQTTTARQRGAWMKNSGNSNKKRPVIPSRSHHPKAYKYDYTAHTLLRGTVLVGVFS